jgi:hypothetical protein
MRASTVSPGPGRISELFVTRAAKSQRLPIKRIPPPYHRGTQRRLLFLEGAVEIISR